MIPASSVFDFLDQNPEFTLERHEVHSAIFRDLRRSLRAIALDFADAEQEDTRAVSDRLRRLLSEWLTVPMPFDGALRDAVSSLGTSEAVELRWGPKVRLLYDRACAAAGNLLNSENPVRSHVRETIRQLETEARSWRIYCHKRARPCFESIFPGTAVTAYHFLHSVRDYRDTVPFDVLVKVGPLRSQGWGSAPDAIISAPRFRTLIQIVWSGCSDEDDFGYDPIAHPTVETTNTGSLSTPSARGHNWTRKSSHIGEVSEDQLATLGEDDDLKLLSRVNRAQTLCRATLVEIDEDHGILSRARSPVASFDPRLPNEQPLSFRVPGETLLEGMFVIRPLLDDADLGELQAADGRYSRIWKECLRKEFARNSTALVRRLRAANLDLLHLHARVKDWCRPATTVIHAPQQKRHFEILITVLGIDDQLPRPSRTYVLEGWQAAWREIAHSRGEAIQTGLQEHEIVNEELLATLRATLPEIRIAAAARSSFQIKVPDGKSLSGIVRFHVVKAIEEGFLVPESLLGTICDLDTIEQWRD